MKSLDAQALVAFYKFQQKNGHSPLIREVAAAINYSEPSAHQALSRLKLMGHLQQSDPFLWRGYQLTESGKKLAQQMLGTGK